MMWWRRQRQDLEIAPDEIFLDASNAPAFDRARFEGRLEKPLSEQIFVSLGVVLTLLVSVLLVRSWNLEVTNGEAFATESAQNSLEARTLFAPRGVITDINGIMLAENVQSRDQGSMERVYPFPSLSHVIGYVSYPKKDSKGIYYDTNETGITGLEAEYDSFLAGRNGQLLTETDALGTVRSEGTIIPAKEGSNLQLAIDANLQKLFARAISSTVDSKRFIAGAGVILDVHTGAVRALVSYPSYDSTVMVAGGPAETIASYATNPGHPFIDHAVQGVYAPGSIVKPFVAAGALTDGLITSNTVIHDPGFISIPDPYRPGKEFIYKGWKELGPVDVQKAIAWSSDVFFYTIGGGFKNQKGLGIDRLKYWYQQFGFGSPTGIDLAGEVGGLVPDPAWKKSVFNEPWYLGDTYFTAIGQYAMQVTPLQAARATAAIANGGRLVTPTLLAPSQNVFGVGLVDKGSAYVTVPVQDSVLAVVREGMRQTVTSALAQALNFSYLRVAAKTGTAQTGTKNQFDNSWVIGFFPYDNPQYAFAVVLERGPSGSGSQAVNVMQQLFDSLYLENSPYVGGGL